MLIPCSRSPHVRLKGEFPSRLLYQAQQEIVCPVEASPLGYPQYSLQIERDCPQEEWQ